MIIVQKRLLDLKWTLWGNNEPNLIQIGKLHHMVRNDQVTNMYGVEGPEKEPYLFHGLVFFWRYLDTEEFGHQFMGFVQGDR